MDSYVARQPIFNRRKKIFGYELLFREATGQYNPDVNGDVATSTVLSNSFFNIGMENLIDGKKSFINFTQNLILRKMPMLLPSARTVVEILEDVEPTPELIQVCREMAQKGYTIALDDFTYAPELVPLIEIADIIKLDFRAHSTDQLQENLRKLAKHGKKSILAEKIESYDEFTTAWEMGFDYFQGFFFCKPELMKGREISGSQVNLLHIMIEINQPDFDFGKLKNLITPDVGLSYKLLRYINSAFFAKAREISSIQQALVYMGEAEIRRFVSLAAITLLAKGKPDELIRISCVRAKFCEFLAEFTPWQAKPEELFTLGMFSLIDAILDQPMERVMSELPLAANIKNALVHRKGPLVGYLALIEYYEKGLWGLMARVAGALNISQDLLPALYNQACCWADAFPAAE
jgi:c-di-GMP-related signal transduction protein